MIKKIGLGFISIFAAVSAALANADALPEIETSHQGINLLAMPLPARNKSGIDLRLPQDGILALKQALDLIYAKSTFSVAAFERLKKAGKVTVVYDADFPKEQLTSVTIAAFFPDFFQKEGNLKEFLVVVGRYGIKWPTDKLAAIIVHELGGHGYQHLKGRTKTDRKIDRECEAQLYEEAALQDFDVKRDSSDMVRFRREMQTNWCSDFRRYMRERDPKLMDLWNFGKPDVPKVLAVFEDYLVHLQKTGVSGSAVAAVRTKRLQDLAALSTKALQQNSGRDMYVIAQRHLNGMGTPKNLGEARKWYLLSAKAGYPAGQHAMGLFWENGLGSPKDIRQAYSWYHLAAKNGNQKAKQRVSTLAQTLTQKEIDQAVTQARSYQSPSN